MYSSPSPVYRWKKRRLASMSEQLQTDRSSLLSPPPLYLSMYSINTRDTDKQVTTYKATKCRPMIQKVCPGSGSSSGVKWPRMNPGCASPLCKCSSMFMYIMLLQLGECHRSMIAQLQQTVVYLPSRGSAVCIIQSFSRVSLHFSGELLYRGVI